MRLKARIFGGPESVNGQLKRGDELRDALYEWPFLKLSQIADFHWFPHGTISVPSLDATEDT